MRKSFQYTLSAAMALIVAATFTGQCLAQIQLDLAGAPTFMSSAEVPDLGNTDALWDGDRGTRIATGNNLDDPPGGDGNDNEWFYVDLGQSYQLAEIRIDWEAAFGQDYDILVSNTDPGGVTNPSDPIWSLAATVRGFDQDGTAPPNHGGDVDNIINFGGFGDPGFVDLVTHMQVEGVDPPVVGASETPEGQYVMMHGQVRGSQWGFSVWEMEVDVVPEPSSLVLTLLGFVALVGYTVRYVNR